ncbi:MAG: glucosaminidase domain-containing protein [Alphaproteobacteria bacterium]
MLSKAARYPTLLVWGIALLGLSIMTLYGLVLADPAGVMKVQPVRVPFSMLSPGHGVDKPGTWYASITGDIERREITSAELDEQFELIDYRLAEVRSGDLAVPRLFVANLPVDLEGVSVIDARKQLFLQTTLPLVLRVNEMILEERGRLLTAQQRIDAGETLSARETQWLADLAGHYETEPGDLEALLLRIDIVPPSLALAQAVTESGWGTSRFVREGNALFGERVFAEGGGVVPHERSEQDDYEVRVFPSLIASVQAYAHNLNTHPAYRGFRAERARLRAASELLTGPALLGGLEAYSEQGARYVKTLRHVIRDNSLWQFDTARLHGVEFAAVTAIGDDS